MVIVKYKISTNNLKPFGVQVNRKNQLNKTLSPTATRLSGKINEKK